MLSLHSSRNPKTEVGTRACGIAVMGQPCFCLKECGLWGLGLGKKLNALSGP